MTLAPASSVSRTATCGSSSGRDAGASSVGRGPVRRCDSSPPMRALITGADGFAGYVQADLLDDAATRAAVRDLRPEAIVHLAAAASVGASWRAPAETLDNNMRSTLNLLEAVRAEA